MAEDDGTSAKIETLKNAITEAQAKAEAGDRMYLVRADYLREKLASLTIPPQQPEPAALPQSVRMAALNTAHTEAKKKAKSEEKSTQKNLGGDTQVTVVPCVPQGVPESPSGTQGDLAGASPHAPHLRRREKPKHQSKVKKNFTIRMADDMRAELDTQSSALGYAYSSALALHLLAAGLKMPVDEYEAQRRRDLTAAYAELTVAWNRHGTLLNQLTAAVNKGQPCPFSRQELDVFSREWRELVITTPKKLGLDTTEGNAMRPQPLLRVPFNKEVS